MSTIYAQSCSYEHVSAAITSASSGDIIILPTDTGIWDKKLTITKGIILKGQGKGKTIIKNNLNPSTYTYWNYLITYTPSSPTLNEPFRITGLEFDGNFNGGGIDINNTASTLAGLLTKIRIDHNYFHNMPRISDYSNRAIMWRGFAYGVTDNNEFKDCYKFVDVEGGGVASWNLLPLTLGSANSVYIEDNIFTQTGNLSVSGLTSAGDGGRYVWRYNTVPIMYACQTLDIHGNVGSNPISGTVSAEIYNNNISLGEYPQCQWNQFLYMRGGTDMIFNNSIKSHWEGHEVDCRLTEEDCPDASYYPAPYQIKNSFLWNNIVNNNEPPLINIPIGYACVQLNRDYWLPIYGLDANKPNTCTPDGYTYYGATDTGKLYKCTSQNTWTEYYRPFTYPHPIRWDCVNYPTLCDETTCPPVIASFNLQVI